MGGDDDAAFKGDRRQADPGPQAVKANLRRTSRAKRRKAAEDPELFAAYRKCVLVVFDFLHCESEVSYRLFERNAFIARLRLTQRSASAWGATPGMGTGGGGEL